MPATFSWFTGLPTVGKAVTAVTVLAVGGILVTALVASHAESTAVVTRVVDGDTIDVTFEGETQRVRLLNIDTPETVDPDEDVQCLGPEASEYLETTLPPGTTVRLAFDQDLRDGYGRLLAGVYLEDLLVNAEIARLGLGAAVVYEPNRRFYDEVKSASDEAFDKQIGLYDEDVECTLGGRFGAYTEQIAALAEQSPETVAEYDSYLEQIAALGATAVALRAMVDLPDTFPAAAYSARAITGWSSFLDDQSRRREVLKQATVEARDAEVARVEVLKLAAEEAARQAAQAEAARMAAEVEAARVASEAEAARVAAEQAAAERAEAKRASADAAARKAASTSDSSSDQGAPASGGDSGSSGYTGCRAYAPGGKTWTPIPCG